MRFWDIDSKEAILAAVYEFDRLGKERFLEKHGYGDAVSYFLVVNGKRYPSEAIVGVAHGYQFPDEGPLQSSDFSGGRETVQKKLEDLGFEVFVEHGLSVEEGPDFIHNNIYRRIDIHNQFGGQRQGGISTPSNRNFVFLFTGEAGQQYGYSDGWTDDGSFFYTGEGQEGDMEFVRGNLAIRDHLDDGKDLYLFQYADRGSVRFLGKFICTGHHFREGPDVGGDIRRIIVFELTPIEYFAKPGDHPQYKRLSEGESLEDLRKQALSTTTTSRTPVERKVHTYLRSEAIKQYALKRAAGYCEGCRQSAPFLKKDGEPYLEVHHIRRLSDSGPDHPEWVAAICPNCHRRAHYSADSEEFNDGLHENVGAKELKFKAGH